MQPKCTSAYLAQKQEQERKLFSTSLPLLPTPLLLLPPLLPIPYLLLPIPEQRRISNLNADYFEEVKTMKKILSSAAAISAVCLMAALPAQASTGNSSSNPLAGITDFLNQAQQSIQEYTQTITEKVGAFGQQFQQIAEDTAGDLGLIDPAKAREQAENIVNPDSATYNAGAAVNEMDRQSARASASSILSEDGQTQQVDAYEGTQTSVDTVGEKASTAQEDDVTQNVMKRIADQNAATTEVLGGVRSDLLKMNEQTAQTNVQLSNVSRSLDGQTAAKNAESIGAGYGNLRTAAQGRLF